MGQTKAVMIYRLVMRATIEERMMQVGEQQPGNSQQIDVFWAALHSVVLPALGHGSAGRMWQVQKALFGGLGGESQASLRLLLAGCRHAPDPKGRRADAGNLIWTEGQTACT